MLQKKFLWSTYIKPGFLMMLAIVVIVCNLAFNWSLQSLKSLKNYFLCIAVLACEYIRLSLLPVTGEVWWLRPLCFCQKNFIVMTQINVYIVNLVVIGFQIRAKNNFQRVSVHNDKPNSFYIGHVSFLAGHIYKVNNSYNIKGPWTKTGVIYFQPEKFTSPILPNTRR